MHDLIVEQVIEKLLTLNESSMMSMLRLWMTEFPPELDVFAGDADETDDDTLYVRDVAKYMMALLDKINRTNWSHEEDFGLNHLDISSGNWWNGFQLSDLFHECKHEIIEKGMATLFREKGGATWRYSFQQIIDEYINLRLSDKNPFDLESEIFSWFDSNLRRVMTTAGKTEDELSAEEMTGLIDVIRRTKIGPTAPGTMKLFDDACKEGMKAMYKMPSTVRKWTYDFKFFQKFLKAFSGYVTKSLLNLRYDVIPSKTVNNLNMFTRAVLDYARKIKKNYQLEYRRDLTI